MDEFQQSKSQTLAIAGTFTTDPLLPALQFVLHEVGLNLDIRFAPYHQVFQELLSPTSLLATNANGVNVVLARLEDFARGTEHIEDKIDTVRRTAIDLANALSHYSEHANAPIVCYVMPPSPYTEKALALEIKIGNEELVERARTLHGVIVLSADAFLDTENFYDRAADELGHMPYTEEGYASIALTIARKTHALFVSPHKVLVLDCDGTLWQGVVGEDGLDGIAITVACKRLQEFAVEIQRMGALVCLLSKNNERDVLEVFNKRSDMTLKLDHIVAHRINWDPKPQNMASLAHELDVGLDSFVFIDDNPVERELMRSELPQVVTLELPPEDEIESFLANLWTFDKVSVSDEDVQRTNLYRSNAARRALEKSTTDLTTFLASLDLVVELAPLEEGDWARAAQLTQRTNQFNFTTFRRNEVELRALQRSGFTLLRAKVRDRFGDYGIVGLVIIKDTINALAVDTFLLSCRALGRGVEYVILRRLGEIAASRALDYISLPYHLTHKNRPAYAFVESVVSDFRIDESKGAVYRIPVKRACEIYFNPGIDSTTLVDSYESKQRKAERGERMADRSPPAGQRWIHYESLARSFVSPRSVLDAIRTAKAPARPLLHRPKVHDTFVERELLVLWQEMLDVDGLSVDDDFFAVGGTSLIAARMIAELSRRFGVKLPLSVIVESPTVRKLSRHLQNHRNPRSEILVQLKSGSQRNLFLVHDGDGETLLYLNLARHMPDDVAVFGVEPRRLPRIPLAHSSIEEMAAFYLKEVRKRQPCGPYFLGGMCAGGVIAYEMASQLIRAGETLTLLALFDSARPRAPMKRREARHPLRKKAKQLVADARNKDSRRFAIAESIMLAIAKKGLDVLHWRFRRILDCAKALSLRARLLLLEQVLERGCSWPKFVPELRSQDIYNNAAARYLPKLLTISPIVLVRATKGEGSDTPFRDIYADDTFGWDTVISNVTIIDTQGGHSTMFREPFVASLAQSLMPFFQEERPSIASGSVDKATYLDDELVG